MNSSPRSAHYTHNHVQKGRLRSRARLRLRLGQKEGSFGSCCILSLPAFDPLFKPSLDSNLTLAQPSATRPKPAANAVRSAGPGGRAPQAPCRKRSKPA